MAEAATAKTVVGNCLALKTNISCIIYCIVEDTLTLNKGNKLCILFILCRNIRWETKTR